ncbi:MAG TPA: TIGR03435 family protein [Candidatus Acidoferrum sp.]|nr:TIGR03435 family protein [Candidatus Acidoferrum sp.]
MNKSRDLFRSRRNLSLSAAGIAAALLLLVLWLAHATPTHALSQSQSTPAAAPVFEYEVASIKPTKPDAAGGFMTIPGGGNVSDTYAAKNMPLINVIREAYGIPMGANDGRLVGAPGWLISERYDVEAKMDRFVVDALQKLSLEDRIVVHRQMLQALLADRLKLTIHRETKEVQVYSLVVAKGGPKLQESKPADADPNATPPPAPAPGRGGRGGRGGPSLGMMGRGGPLTGQQVPMAMLATVLTTILNHPVLDKTGLTGNYDFTLTWTPDDTQNQGPPGAFNGQPPLPAPDPNGPTIFMAIQEQLGLKLESGKGPVEIIVIDHVEKPSGN